MARANPLSAARLGAGAGTPRCGMRWGWAVACTWLLSPGWAAQAANAVGPSAPDLPAQAAGTPAAAPAAPATAAPATDAPAAQPAPPLAAAKSHSGVLSTSAWGGRGLSQVASAYPLTAGAFVLGIRSDYFRAKSLFLSGDTDSASGQRVHAAFSPVQGLEVAVGQESLANSYTGPVPRNLQLQGNPSLRVKYGHHVVGPLALGVLGQVNVPTVQGGAASLWRSTGYAAMGLVSAQPLERLEVMGNLGFVGQRGRHVIANEVPDAVQRFAFNINATSAVRWGLGVTGRITLGGAVDLLPFAEATGDVGLARAATYRNNPVQATLGLRGYLSHSRAVELIAGSDVRIAGGPRPDSPYAGLAPWRAFLQVAVHLGEAADGRGAASAAPAQLRTFRIRGQAIDVDTGRPVAGASVHLAGDEALLSFGTDEETGQFVSAPQPVGQGTVHVVAKAPGYLTFALDLPRSADGRDVETTFKLQAEAQSSKMALLKGSIKDAATGAAVLDAEVSLQAINRTLHGDKAGAFGALVKPGRVGIIIRAPGYEPQRKSLQLRAGESTVLNVDLEATAH